MARLAPVRCALATCLLVALLVTLGSASCGDAADESIGDEQVATLGPEGGVLRVRGGTLLIPEGALKEPTEITFRVSELGAPEVPDRVRVTRSFHLTPQTLRLLTFATLTIDYLPERLPGTVHASQFDVRRSDSSLAQERLNGVSVDADARNVSGEVLQLGVFWGTVPEASRPATIELSNDAQVLSVGQTLQLEARILDQAGMAMAAEAAGLSFSSSDAVVASVDGNGLVTALAPGIATLTAAAGAARATAQISVRSDAPIAQDFEWENPLPQGNSLTAVTRDEAGAIYVAAMGGAIWRRPPGGRFELLHEVSDARFTEMVALGGRLVAVGAVGSSGILLTIDGIAGSDSSQTSDLSVRTLAVAGTALKRVFFVGTKGISIGDGDHLLVFDASLDAWQAVSNPSFDNLVAGGFSGENPRVLTSSGLIYERVGEGWARLAVEGSPTSTLIDAVAFDEGAFAAIDEASRLWRFDDVRGWREVSLVLDAADAARSGNVWRHGRSGGDGEGEEEPDAGEAADGQAEVADAESTGAGDEDVLPAEDAEVPEAASAIMTLRAIFPMEDRVMLRAIETPEDAPSLAQDVVLFEPLESEASAGDDAATLGEVFERLELPSEATGALWASDKEDLIAVGTAGAIRWWHEGRWNVLSSGETGWIIALEAFESDAIHALVERCLDANCLTVENRLIARTESGVFEDLTPAEGFFGRMRAMGGHSAEDFWVMGEGGIAYRWQRGAWSTIELSTGAIFAIERCGGDLYAAGQNGQVFRQGDGVWSLLAQTGSAALRGLGCAGDSLFAVGDYQISTWVRGSPVSLTPNDDAIRTAPWKAVFVTSEGKAFIGGDARYILLWNGTNFEYFDNPAGLLVYNVRALHGTGYTDVWAAGMLTSGEGFLAHFDGAEWRSIDPETVRPLLSITGSPGGTVWIGGGNGSILRGLPMVADE